MDTALKTLVALTCVVLIAGVGYWFWDLQRNRAEATAQSSFSAARSACLDELNKAAHEGADNYMSDIRACGNSGYISAQDINDAVKRSHS